MKLVPQYYVRITHEQGQSQGYVDGRFLQIPSRAELLELLEAEIARAEKAVDDELESESNNEDLLNKHRQTAEQMRNCHQIWALTPEQINKPGEIIVFFAGVRIGKVIIKKQGLFVREAA